MKEQDKMNIRISWAQIVFAGVAIAIAVKNKDAIKVKFDKL